MRCATCGTQNEPDSRFCGGCGARLQGTLAPTHKIVPDPVVAHVPFPQAPQYQPPLAAQPAVSREQQAQAIARQVSAEYAAQRPRTPSSVPASAGAYAAGSAIAPPSPSASPGRPSSAVPVRAADPPSQPQHVAASRPRSSAGVSLAAPRRNWGLIILVLVFDLGLAAAGIYLLNEGLSAGAPAPASSDETGARDPVPTADSVANVPAKKSQVPAPTPSTPPPSTEPAVADARSDTAAVRADVVDAAPVAEAIKPVEAPSARKPRPKPRRAPIDPYPDVAPDEPIGPVVGPEKPPE